MCSRQMREQSQHREVSGPVGQSDGQTLATQSVCKQASHQAAPTTDREMARPIPRFAHIKGDVSVRNLVDKNTKHKTNMCNTYC